MTRARPAMGKPRFAAAGSAASDKRVIQAIQVSRRQVAGLADDDTWRAWLRREIGKDSLRTMSSRELARTLDKVRKLGGKPSAGPKASRYADDDQHRMMRGLWIELADLGVVRDRSETALDAYIKRMSDGQDMGALLADDANKMIEGLKAMRRRAQEGHTK